MKRNITLILALGFIIAALAVILLNNRTANPASPLTKTEEPRKSLLNSTPTTIQSGAKPKKSAQQPSKKYQHDFLFAHTTKKIICPLKIEPMLYVEIKVRMSYADKNLQTELNYKGEDLEAVIQNILYQCERKDLKAPVLRKKILQGVNGFLETGRINDITFKDFKIEIKGK